MHDTQYEGLLRHDLAAVRSYRARLAIEISHARHALDELVRRQQTIEALESRLASDHAATVGRIKREQRQAAQSRKWRESVPR